MTKNKVSGSTLLPECVDPFKENIGNESDQKAHYEGLQITSSMRLNKIMSFNAFYTLSKTYSGVLLRAEGTNVFNNR